MTHTPPPSSIPSLSPSTLRLLAYLDSKCYSLAFKYNIYLLFIAHPLQFLPEHE